MTQPIAAPNPQSASRPSATWQWAAPWVILAVWLAVDLAVVLYWACREWGFLEAVPLLIALALHLLGLSAWLTAFAALADCRVQHRSAYFAVGTATAAAIGVFFLGFGDFRTALGFAAFQVGLALPPVILRQLGWRIAAAASDAANGSQPRPRWQFTLGDLLLTTSLIALFLGLLLASGGFHNLNEVYFLAALLCGAPGVIVISLAWRRFWLAAATSWLGCTLLALLPIAWHDSTRLGEIMLLLLIVAFPVVSLLAASGCLRRAGYRLR